MGGGGIEGWEWGFGGGAQSPKVYGSMICCAELHPETFGHGFESQFTPCLFLGKGLTPSPLGAFLPHQADMYDITGILFKVTCEDPG